ncbi:hypothetical protein SS50377_22143 [Spironucleus salmonicida]|uniref:Tetratricopeptide repeat domain-containing protein n=1 Tax=Spironucleus salmonicida TaxID=348837 RepID=V6LN96_9EUKA|nr:hypothetical protein SS50377_22143 [Spironucleus salmonicida]|eukprot:EST45698.1 Tetratricopeptide repeat domain-containing protein [Spironucleus salmonicida]
MTEESSDSTDWSLHPLFIDHTPSQAHIDKSPQLQGIQSMLFEESPDVKQGTLRTQGNNCMAVALRQQDKNLLRQHLRQALSCYTEAIETETNVLEPEKSLKLAVIYSNRSECFRLLEDYARAFQDADAAFTLDQSNWKSIVRKAKICENLSDFSRAIYYWKKVWDVTNQQQVKKSLNVCKIMLKNIEIKLSAQKLACQETCGNVRFGKLLPFIAMEQSQVLESYNLKSVHIYILDLETLQVDTLQDCYLDTKMKDFQKILETKKKFTFRENWTDMFDEHIKPSQGQQKVIIINNNKTLREIINDERYIVPGVISFYIE